MKRFLSNLLGLALILFLSCADNLSLEYPNIDELFQYGSMTDGVKTYKTIEIGTQIWMAENLNYDTAGSKCYNNVPANCEKYGRLYDWETAKKVCPDGWHIPSNDEWETLIDFVKYPAGTQLKATSEWEYKGTDIFGFAALPGGYRDSSNFRSIGEYGGWWSSDEDDNLHALVRYIYYDNAVVSDGRYEKSYLFSVRCLKDKD